MGEDIVDRLRRQESVLAREAADEIETLRKVVRRYAGRAAGYNYGKHLPLAGEITRVLAALGCTAQR
jgi:hypothetical protein